MIRRRRRKRKRKRKRKEKKRKEKKRKGKRRRRRKRGRRFFNNKNIIVQLHEHLNSHYHSGISNQHTDSIISPS